MPRSFFNHAKRSFLALFGGIWLLVGLPFLGIGIGTALSELRLQREGKVTAGTVLTKDVRRATKKRSTTYSVTYRFTTAEGETVTDKARLDFDRWEQLQEQGPIPIRYLSSRPSSNRPEYAKSWLLPVIFSSFGLLFSGVGGFLFFKGIAGIFRNMRLEREGSLAKATVTAVEETNLRVNGRAQWRIYYQFTDRQGRKVEGKSEVMPYEEVSRFQQGTTGNVRFDPEKPSANLWLG